MRSPWKKLCTVSVVGPVNMETLLVGNVSPLAAILCHKPELAWQCSELLSTFSWALHVFTAYVWLVFLTFIQLLKFAGILQLM